MKISLHVIGTGGTGTYFLKEICRFLSSQKNSVNVIHIYDGDTVEEKNLSRQCFDKEDIGRNKASVMNEILSATYPSLTVYSHPYYIKEETDIRIVNNYGYTNVIVCCVDNHAARVLIEKIFDKQKELVVFDAANEYECGEVVYAYKLDGKVIGPCRSHYFPDILTGDLRPVTEMSCEELNNVSPQHIFTNMCAGQHLCAGIANLLNDVVHPGFTMFNSLKLSSNFYPLKRKDVGLSES